MKRQNISKLGLVGLVLLFGACDTVDDFIDPYPPSGLRPEITNITPDPIEGGNEVTITGNNFSPNAEKNMVVFGKKAVTPTTATATTLTLTAPRGLAGLEQDTIEVKIVVQNSELISDGYQAVVLPSYSILDYFDFPAGVAVDLDGNVYVSDGDQWAVFKYPANGQAKVLYAKINTDPEVYTDTGGNGDITFDAAGNLYICIGGDWGDEIYKVPPGGGDAELLYEEGGYSAFDCDFDEWGNMWTAGRRRGIHRISPAGELLIDLYDLGICDNNTLSCRVFEGYLYWSERDEDRIMRIPITENGIGTAEVFFEDDSETYFDRAHGIDIDADGNVYVVSNSWDGSPNLSKISPDGTPEVLMALPTYHHRHIAIGNQSVYVCVRGGPDNVLKVPLGIEPAPQY